MRPYISFVTWGRNDGYTDDYVHRVNRATSCLAQQLERAGVASEIIIIDWNPPSDHPSLLAAVDLPKNLEHVTIRGAIVGRQFHERMAGSSERGLNGGEAANVGIRRARGQFVTPKASDTFLSPAAIEMIARQDLDPDTMYRMDRQDFAVSDASIWDLDDDSLLATLDALPSVRHAYIEQMPYWQLRDLHTNACGDFTLMGTAYWHLVRGHSRDETVLSLDSDSLVMHAAAAQGVRECRWPEACKIFKPVHGNLNSARVIPLWTFWQRALDDILRTHVNRGTAHWFRTLFNYPRRKVRGVDSVLGPSIEKNFVRPARRWTKGVYPIPTQSENWGLADEKLEERVLCRAAWDKAGTAAVT